MAKALHFSGYKDISVSLREEGDYVVLDVHTTLYGDPEEQHLRLRNCCLVHTLEDLIKGYEEVYGYEK